MVLLKKNIWMIYLILWEVSIACFLLYTAQLWHSNKKPFIDSQNLQIELFSDSVASTLQHHEALLNMLSEKITELNDYTLTASIEVEPILNNLHSLFPAISEFGLADKAGNIIAISTDKPITDDLNIMTHLTNKEILDSIISSQRMVIGRTRYDDNSHQLIIPFFKAIKDQNGQVAAILWAKFDLERSPIFHDNMHMKSFHEISILRDDRYNQFASGGTQYSEVYANPISNQSYNAVIKALQKKYDLDLADIKSSQRTYNVTLEQDTALYQIIIKYNRTYHIWIMSKVELHGIYKLFYYQLASSLSIFLIIHLIFYFLFRSIANSEQKRHDELVFQANHDQLTLLPNRLFLRENIHHWTNNKTEPFSLFFIDIDNFKSVNDTYGHDFGDKILWQIAQRLKAFHNERNLLIREASDEFILLNHISSSEQIEPLATEIIDSLSKPYQVSNKQFILSCSIGIANYPEHGRDLDELLRAADLAMFKAKLNRNTFNIFTLELQSNHFHRVKIEQRLRLAIENDEMYMVYQPQVDVDGNLHGVEALVRWQDEVLGFVPPDQFIAIAESCGLMPRLGQYILETSLKEIADLQRSLKIDFFLSINTSVRQFMQSNFIEHLLDTIKLYQYRHNLLSLEITENLFIEDLDHVKPICEVLHNHGINISLDDFGTGYSSLSMLRELPIDELKIDKSFMDNIHSDEQSLKMVQNIIAIGKNLGMNVLAEGVETLQHKDILVDCQCDLLQGYYFAKPMKVSELRNYINKLRGNEIFD